MSENPEDARQEPQPDDNEQTDHQASNRSTRFLGMPTAPELTPRDTGPLDKGLGPPWRIILRIKDLGISIGVDVANEICIGRADKNFTPDVDLTPYGAIEAGVSRRHIILRAESDRMSIIDQGGTNGTRLNGYALTPDTSYRVRHNDSLMLGDLALQVGFALTPPDERRGPAIRRGLARSRSKKKNFKTGSLRKFSRVLLYEKDADIAAACQQALEARGFTVEVENEPDGIIEKVEGFKPDVIVVDVQNDEQAILVTKTLRNHPETSDISLFMTHGILVGSGADYVKKMGTQTIGTPVTVESLVDTLESVR